MKQRKKLTDSLQLNLNTQALGIESVYRYMPTHCVINRWSCDIQKTVSIVCTAMENPWNVRKPYYAFRKARYVFHYYFPVPGENTLSTPHNLYDVKRIESSIIYPKYYGCFLKITILCAYYTSTTLDTLIGVPKKF